MLVEKLNALPKKLDFSITATQGSGNYMPHVYSRATTMISIVILKLAGIDADHFIWINLMRKYGVRVKCQSEPASVVVGVAVFS